MCLDVEVEICQGFLFCSRVDTIEGREKCGQHFSGSCNGVKKSFSAVVPDSIQDGLTRRDRMFA